MSAVILFLLLAQATLRTKCGIQVSEQAVTIWEEVQMIYEMPIQCVTVSTGPFGSSFVNPVDGTPVIELNAKTGRDEITILHELFHLRLRGSGFAIPYMRFDQNVDQQSRDTVAAFIQRLLDQIEHSIFYSDIRKLGHDPSTNLNGDYRALLKNPTFVFPDKRFLVEARAIEYLHLALESSDQELLREFRFWYEREKWMAAIDLGARLIETIRKANPSTREDVINLLVECFRIALGDRIDLTFEGFENREAGDVPVALANFRIGIRANR